MHAIRVALAFLLAAGLAGCSTAPTIEFTTPRVLMHVEGGIASVEPMRGQPKIEKVSDSLYRVQGTGDVQVNQFHLVQVDADRIRVHGMDIESNGTARNVFVEKDKAIGGVHPDRAAR